jgi:hypothetical protein
MKKLIMFFGFLGLGIISVQAQSYGRNHSPYNDYDERYRNGRNSDFSWGYDRDYRVVRGNRELNKINNFQERAKTRIIRGIDRGLITRREADRLWNEYRMIERKENRYMRNGRLSAREVNELENDLARLNRMINHEKSDWNRTRPRF